MTCELVHLHLLVRNVSAHRTFWTTLGGVPVEGESLALIRFPGVDILLREGEPSGGTVGSVINHFGFAVKSLETLLTRYEAAGFEIQRSANPGQAFVLAEDGVRIELTEVLDLDVPIRMHHLHWNTSDVHEIQAWYVRVFGAVPRKRNQFDGADLAGVHLTFSHVDAPTSALRGRALDCIGFEVRNLEECVAKMQADGISTSSSDRTMPSSNIRMAFLSDPWGTAIALTDETFVHDFDEGGARLG